jgi:hypothetical protein
MLPVYSRAALAEQAISRLYSGALLQWLHGEPVDFAATRDQIRKILRDEFAKVARHD